jgi:hypothetical protein
MHLSSGKKSVITLPAIVAVLAFLGVPSAVADDAGPKVTPVSVRFTVNEVISERRAITCTGQDGPYREVRQTFVSPTPTIVDVPAGDPNGTGTLVVRLKLLHKGTSGPTGFGTFSGTAYIISSATNTITVAGRFLGVTNEVAAGGIYEAIVNGPNPATNGKLIGTFDITLETPDPTTGDPTVLSGTLGGLGGTIHPAVVVKGGCEHDADDIMEQVD